MISHMKAYIDEKTALSGKLDFNHLGIKINVKRNYPLFLLIATASMTLKDYEVFYQRKKNFNLKRIEQITSYFEAYEKKHQILDIMMGCHLDEASQLLEKHHENISKERIDENELWLSFEERKYESWYKMVALSTDDIETIRLTNQMILLFSKGRMYGISENHVIKPYLGLFHTMIKYDNMHIEELRCLEMYATLDAKNRALFKLYLNSNLFKSLLYDLDDFDEANTIISKLESLGILEVYLSLNVEAAKLLGGI